ncbi:proline iminopeptidase [Legionella beliardensis]|uniref:Proline iminopeptidase n=1 Tax=Legionella beliardensis TaxID=91822 RepID=A0A378I3N4_9GAMM|nr:prolyl aminopeptidase [Legionella beliardensis]STX29603.1 proline iminopeptidase [Legionella beliardensis]
MQNLYPIIKPYKCYELPVGKPHVLYVEETGNPEGIPVVILHAGPGAGGDITLRRFFDPELYRIIIFDQRGCGRSTPHAELQNNNTELLVEDIETIRHFLKLQHIILFGIGWGALLALLYAQKYPHNVNSFLFQRVFLGRQQDIDWFYKKGANIIYPDYWKEFIELASVEERKQIIDYYTNCLQGDNELARMAAAKNWALWEARCSCLQVHVNFIEEYTEPHFALALATLQSYYLTNHYFIEENQILNNIDKVKHIPAYLIHGRYDMVCPLTHAWELHQMMPLSQLSIVREAGHSYCEPGIIDALITATKQLAYQNNCL